MKGLSGQRLLYSVGPSFFLLSRKGARTMPKPLAQNDGEHWSKSIFRKSGLSLGTLASRLGVSYEHLSYVLCGRSKPSKKLEDRLEQFALTVQNSFKNSKDSRDVKKQKIVESSVSRG